MANPFYIFKIKREERWMALVAFLAITALNVLCIIKYFDSFSRIVDNYRKLFVSTFHISGFDPVTYWVVSDWYPNYNIYRHPLLPFFMYIPSKINQGLMMLTGMNWSQIIVAAILIFCSFYAFIFFYRIVREVIGLKRFDATLLSAFFYSFSYVLVASIVPDHFIMSMFMLLLTLYVAGKKLQKNKPFTKWQTILFFIVTAGISLNNGIKIFLANFFVNGKKFWRPANLLLAIMLPAILIWAGARLEWKHYAWPGIKARNEVKAKKNASLRAQLYKQYRDTVSTADSAAIEAGFKRLLRKKRFEKYQRDQKQVWNRHSGKPINRTEFGQWTDITTPRIPSLIENTFGEPIQLHQDYLLQDVLRNRPVIVNYRWIGSYVVEALIMLFFVLGVWCGRRSRLLWLGLSFLAFDMLIHLALGFGINEIYIMSPHYLFAIPLAIAFLVKAIRSKVRVAVILSLMVITLYLYVYNGILLVSYLLM